MEDCVLLEWTFTPPDYFEEGIFIERENHTMKIEKKQSLADLVEKYRPHDKLLASMLASHHAAVHDPANELVYLYEIREALATHFGGEAKVRAILPISASDWSRLGQLANDQPLRQGRHRGKRIGELRDANETEIKEVRRIALVMIEAYLDYLENQQ